METCIWPRWLYFPMMGFVGMVQCLAATAIAIPDPFEDLQSDFQAWERAEQIQSIPTAMLSVSELSDVDPADWAYAALRSLIEHYELNLGYPNQQFQGDRPLSRDEFAAALSQTLDQLSGLLASSEFEITRAELDTIQRLQQDFATELQDLSSAIANLEPRIDTLTTQQFSPTTQLRPQVIFSSGIAIAESDEFDSQVPFGYKARFNFDSSFTGRDRLRVRFQASDIESFESDPIGFSFDGVTDGLISLNDLYYNFPINDDIQVTVALSGVGADDLIVTTVSPMDRSGYTGLSNFGTPAQYDFASLGRGGVGAIFQLTDNLSFDLGYAVTEPWSTRPGAGFFNGDYSLIGQFTYLSDRLDAAVMYMHSYRNRGFLSDLDSPAVANTYGVQVNYRLSDRLELGGGLAYIPVITLEQNDAQVWSYQGTFTIADLGRDGSVLGLLAGVPSYARDASEDPSFYLEGFYSFPVSDRIVITPGVYWISAPFNNSENPDAIFAALRTTIRF